MTKQELAELDCQKPECGRCCCNCKYHIEDFEHCTTNKPLRQSRGGCICSTHKGWICIPPEWEGAHSDWSEHGLCEMHDFVSSKEPIIKGRRSKRASKGE